MAKIGVAMSGGVDSSVAAGLLVAEGHEVVGLTMNLWPAWLPEPDDAFRACCGVSAIEDARAVARTLGIRHYVLNMREAFERAVIDDFLDEYARGRTPNPCITCNRAIKFSLLLRKAETLGLDGLATGHYARVRYDATQDRYQLLRGRDPAKDQSYVLYALRQDQLRRVRFPVGDHGKAEIRDAARRMGLPVADKPDSQDICFVPRGHYTDLLSARRPEAVAVGPILDRRGRTVGTHHGVAHFTIGQRRGLGVATGRPLYVTGLDPGRNAVIVGGQEDLLAREVTVRRVSWVSGEAPAAPARVAARLRHGAHDVGATAWTDGRHALHVSFDEPQRAAAPGQAVTLYQGDVVLGGGIIETVRTGTHTEVSRDGGWGR